MVVCVLFCVVMGVEVYFECDFYGRSVVGVEEVVV